MKFNVCPGHPNLSIGPVWPLAPDRCAGYLDHFFAPGRAGRAGTELDAGAQRRGAPAPGGAVHRLLTRRSPPRNTGGRADAEPVGRGRPARTQRPPRRLAHDYAAEVGAELIAYHGLNFAEADGPAAARLRERAQLEELSLIPLLQRAHSLGITVAIENLAPVYPSPPAQARRCNDPIAVRDLVRRLDSPAAGMLLDLGHLHITADATRSDHAAVLAACASEIVLFHTHDNLGCRRAIDAPGVDPIKLDLHLPPGRGSLPWPRLAGTIAAHGAPVMLEVERSYRPALDVLAADAARLLALAGAAPAAGAA